jgi:hypothetical protein
MPKKKTRPKKKLKPVMRIYCEGEKTEPNYLNSYLDEHFPGNRTLKVARVEPTKKNTPEALVDEAVDTKRASPKGDIFWVVYDRESEQKYPGSIHARARNKADSNGIEIALSNVCFEVWFLLHFEENAGPYVSYDDLYKRSPLRKHLPGYDKGVRNIYNLLREHVDTARTNAKKLNRKTEQGADPDWTRPDQWNPYTNVPELLDAIDSIAAQTGRHGG